jgi:putative FmdB family regulatory protein
MPIYAYRCQECDYGFDGMNSVENRHNVTCHKCGGPCRIDMANQIPNFLVLEYNDPNLGRITGPRQKSRKLKEMGLVETDESYSSMERHLPDPDDVILRSPEAEREFLKIVEEHSA